MSWVTALKTLAAAAKREVPVMASQSTAQTIALLEQPGMKKPEKPADPVNPNNQGFWAQFKGENNRPIGTCTTVTAQVGPLVAQQSSCSDGNIYESLAVTAGLGVNVGVTQDVVLANKDKKISDVMQGVVAPSGIGGGVQVTHNSLAEGRVVGAGPMVGVGVKGITGVGVMRQAPKRGLTPTVPVLGSDLSGAANGAYVQKLKA